MQEVAAVDQILQQGPRSLLVRGFAHKGRVGRSKSAVVIKGPPRSVRTSHSAEQSPVRQCVVRDGTRHADGVHSQGCPPDDGKTIVTMQPSFRPESRVATPPSWVAKVVTRREPSPASASGG